ncbi:hypothetical protein GCM10010393_26140 [Streptomyces gobitricini]|uniref:Uncharacterized protein n=1 Tax=Streptomyces gobitricini TaxID=68211 RepID=A0ABN3M0C4_9ACTN
MPPYDSTFSRVPPFSSVHRYTLVPSSSVPKSSFTGLPPPDAYAVPPVAAATSPVAAAAASTVRLLVSIRTPQE